MKAGEKPDTSRETDAVAKAKPPVGTRLRVFFSWQSDLNPRDTTHAIRSGLREAASQIEDDTEFGITIYIDEATRDEAGSPDIPRMIQEKIEAADVFVADVTTAIRGPTVADKCSPNPNVLVELGLAAATLGWSRVVLLFNEEYGSLKELPFDIDRRRISKFGYMTPDKSDKDGKSRLMTMKLSLRELLVACIKTVVERKPLRPSELKVTTPAQMQRARDVRTLSTLFQQISLPIMDLYFEEARTKYILHDSLYFYESVIGFVGSASFYLHDAAASKLTHAFAQAWEEVHSGTEWMSPVSSGNKYKFDDLTMVAGLTSETYDAWTKAMKSFEVAVRKHYKAFRELLEYVRNEYHEIDVDACSRLAESEWMNWKEKMAKVFSEDRASSTASKATSSKIKPRKGKGT